ncbi:hypothetical protein SB00610_03999 [Klebsiella quasipneumoniae subsp. similipneumoniae]|nr:hypothetical protein SB00610_03999 [Klebsiella quasipneumoniae subsp. similipneumoniae]
MVPKITTVATATVTLLASALTTGSLASTAAAPQMLLPAPISQLVCLSSPNTFWPRKQAMKKVLESVRTSIKIPLTPTSAIWANVRRKP